MVISRDKIQPTKPAMGAKEQPVLSVIDVKLAADKTYPPKLIIGAQGTVGTPGWTNAKLVPFVYIQPPPDGIYDFNFVATPPTKAVPQVVTCIDVKHVLETIPKNLKGVRIHAQTNSQVAYLNAPNNPRI